MLHPELLGRFTTHLKDALQKGLLFALNNNRFLLESGDVLVGLLQEKGSIGAEILHKLSLKNKDAEKTFAVFSPRKEQPITPDLSPSVKKILETCILSAHSFEHKYIGTEHLLFALLHTTDPDMQAFFETRGINLQEAKEQVSQVLKSTARFPNVLPEQEEPPHASQEQVRPHELAHDFRRPSSNTTRLKALEVFAHELTAQATLEKLDPLIGRETEMERLTEILCRRTKNNPLLIGEPGVGKTAIVEGLAQRIASGSVPDMLYGKRLYSVDLALMVAGTMYRGEFEARLKQLIEEVTQDKNIILFIDEMHTLVGAGSASGSMDAANILKPALARGAIRCIGATTWNEYKKTIEPDAALERRYQPLHIVEPTAEATQAILRGVCSGYENHHGVRFTEDALRTAVHLAERHLADRFFPDKAIDLLDEAGAHVNARRHSHELLERLRTIDIAIGAARERKNEAVSKGTLDTASEALTQEERLCEEKAALEQKANDARKAKPLTVQAEDIAKIVARMARIPLTTLQTNERDQLLELESRLTKTIIGQTDAIRTVSDTIRRARLGLSDPRRPKASFLFVGPSGVGKTELARALAEDIFGSKEAFVKFDMSEFAEGHSVSKLLGSPAGYVGYKEGNRLSDVVRKNPHALFLFDEFEKAHTDVQHLLLQALEDGHIMDASGRPASFRHAYIVLTSNVGAEYGERARLGFGATERRLHEHDAAIKEQLKDRFRPELLNRLDKIVLFRALEREDLKKIVRREIDLVLARLTERYEGVYRVGNDVLEWLVSRPNPQEEGARMARRLVEQELTSLLSKALLTRPKKRAWKVHVRKNVLAIT